MMRGACRQADIHWATQVPHISWNPSLCLQTIYLRTLTYATSIQSSPSHSIIFKKCFNIILPSTSTPFPSGFPD